MVLQNEQILWQILAASPKVLGNISCGKGYYLFSRLGDLVGSSEEDTILLLYGLLEARLLAVRFFFFFFLCNKLMWRNLIEGQKIGVLRPIRTEVALSPKS
ncbi:hypothetical protein SO802_010462 [Lithocarpus litseifolius]|uniref:Uncharacterized protein n=1 Tax=Lithocarpus litseifolius TaxID=425828 RepID=A0AAW2DI49_9ROSI